MIKNDNAIIKDGGFPDFCKTDLRYAPTDPAADPDPNLYIFPGCGENRSIPREEDANGEVVNYGWENYDGYRPVYYDAAPHLALWRLCIDPATNLPLALDKPYTDCPDVEQWAADIRQQIRTWAENA